MRRMPKYASRTTLQDFVEVQNEVQEMLDNGRKSPYADSYAAWNYERNKGVAYEIPIQAKLSGTPEVDEVPIAESPWVPGQVISRGSRFYEVVSIPRPGFINIREIEYDHFTGRVKGYADMQTFSVPEACNLFYPCDLGVVNQNGTWHLGNVQTQNSAAAILAAVVTFLLARSYL